MAATELIAEDGPTPTARHRRQAGHPQPGPVVAHPQRGPVVGHPQRGPVVAQEVFVVDDPVGSLAEAWARTILRAPRAGCA